MTHETTSGRGSALRPMEGIAADLADAALAHVVGMVRDVPHPTAPAWAAVWIQKVHTGRPDAGGCGNCASIRHNSSSVAEIVRCKKYALNRCFHPRSPADAQDIVAAYLRCLNDHDAEIYPCSVGDLPYPKDILRPAFRTAVATLVALERMTEKLREYLQIAYVSLAD